MIQLDQVLNIRGGMISNGSSTDHTTYVNIDNFEWDHSHEYWKPKLAPGDKITLQMTTLRDETSRLGTSPQQRLPSPLPLTSATVSIVKS